MDFLATIRVTQKNQAGFNLFYKIDDGAVWYEFPLELGSQGIKGNAYNPATERYEQKLTTAQFNRLKTIQDFSSRFTSGNIVVYPITNGVVSTTPEPTT